MENILIDTNIFISALLKSKSCAKILHALKQNKFNLILSEELLQEILIVAGNPKFEFSEYEKAELKELLIEKSKLVRHKEKLSVCRDSKDNIVLECAIAGRANFIVTGDIDILSLKEFRGIRILTPKQFINQLKDSS